MLRAIVLALLLVPATAAAAPWVLSPETRVVVEVPWQNSRVNMHFLNVVGTVEFDERRLDRAAASISVSSREVETGFGPGNALARSSGYLAADRFPTITFTLDRLVQTSRSTADVHGRITFRGVTRPIVFNAAVFRYGPADDDPDRFEAGFNLAGSIDRTEFGSTTGLPDVGAVLPVYIRLLMTSK